MPELIMTPCAVREGLLSVGSNLKLESCTDMCNNDVAVIRTPLVKERLHIFTDNPISPSLYSLNGVLFAMAMVIIAEEIIG